MDLQGVLGFSGLGFRSLECRGACRKGCHRVDLQGGLGFSGLGFRSLECRGACRKRCHGVDLEGGEGLGFRVYGLGVR